MKIFIPLYLKSTKNQFLKPFHPLQTTKKPNYLISAPTQPNDFLKALPFLGGLRDSGQITILMPKALESIHRILKRNLFSVIFYDEPPIIFSRSHKMIKNQLGNKHFENLIEMNVPANISLPYLVSAEKRICFCGENNFPYYNILVQDGVNTLCEFFHIKACNPQELFHFNAVELRRLKKSFNKRRPWLFINSLDDIEWRGDKIVVDKDILTLEPRAYEALYLADAYYGKQDTFFELAKIFEKQIIEK